MQDKGSTGRDLVVSDNHHPVLRRHYSTIGIGDVFILPNEQWQLPSSYFGSRRQPPNAATQQLPVITTTTEIPTRFLGDEMIGTIKKIPEDFIVREIAILNGGSTTPPSTKALSKQVVVADLGLCSTQFHSINVNDDKNDTTFNNNSVDQKIQLSQQQGSATTTTIEDGGANDKDDCHHTNNNRDNVLVVVDVEESTTTVQPSRQQRQEQEKQPTTATSSSLDNVVDDGTRRKRTEPLGNSLLDGDSIVDNKHDDGNDPTKQHLQIVFEKYLHHAAATIISEDRPPRSPPPSATIPTISQQQRQQPQDRQGFMTTGPSVAKHAMLLLQAMEQETLMAWEELAASTVSHATESSDPSRKATTLDATNVTSIAAEVFLSTSSTRKTTIDSNNNSKTVELLFAMETKLGNGNVNDDNIQKQQQQKYIRREIHEALRNAFPIFNAESTAIDDSTTMDNSNLSLPDDVAVEDHHHHQQLLHRIRVTVDDTFVPIVTSLLRPAEDLPPLYAFAKRGYEYAQQQQQQRSSALPQQHRRQRQKPGPVLRLKPDLPRTHRRPIHQLIDSKSKGFLGTETLNDYPMNHRTFTNSDTTASTTTTTTTAIAVHWTNVAVRKLSKKRCREESEMSGIAPPSNILLCVLRKRKKEHLTLIHTLATAYQCRPADIGLAGIKDFQAVAYQFCTLDKKISPTHVVASSTNYLHERGIDVVPLCKVAQPLGKGDLIGNRFEIVIRDVQRVQLSYDDNNHNNPPVETFVTVDESYFQTMLRRVERGGFVNFYGEQRVGEPGHTAIAGVRAFDIGRAMIQQNFALAIDLLITGRRIVNGLELIDDNIDRFRRVWKETNGDPVATMKHLPPGENSVPRERTILRGLIRHGTDNPLTALRCLQRNERLFFVNCYQSYIWNTMATERIRKYGNKVVPGDLIMDLNSNKPVLATVESSMKESFDKVVLPMVGYDIMYPGNSIGDMYQDLLKSEAIVFDKNAPDESTAKGSYRRLVSKVTNLSYDILERKQHSLDIRVSFDLPKGSYATMFLRELMLKTVARDFSHSMNDKFE